MANKKITKPTASIFNNATKVTPVALTSSDTGLIECNYDDSRTVISIVDGSAGATVTVEPGNGYAGSEAYVVKLDASGEYRLALDSAAYKKVSGTHKGNIVVTTDNNITISVAEAK